MNSMTGYGSSQFKDRRLELEIHVKSVNGRFLETRFHLPKEYAPLENDLRRQFQGWSRGTVDIYVHRRPAAAMRLQSVWLREESARHWAGQLAGLAKRLGLNPEFSMRDILQMPFVMEQQDRVALVEGEPDILKEQLRRALDRCLKMRSVEGGRLKRELSALLKELGGLITAMETWREEAMKSSHQRLKSRLAALEAESLDPSRLAMETALMIDKMDIHEEMVRLKEHVRACIKLVQTGQGQGKKLDFYCQELLREVNTIGSKSQLASLTRVVVDAKSIIERFREQVQNIE